MLESQSAVTANENGINQNEININALYSKLEAIESKVDLIIKHLNVDLCGETNEIAETYSAEDESADNPLDETNVDEEKSDAVDFSYLRNEINALKTFIKE